MIKLAKRTYPNGIQKESYCFSQKAASVKVPKLLTFQMLVPLLLLPLGGKSINQGNYKQEEFLYCTTQQYYIDDEDGNYEPSDSAKMFPR